MEFGICSCFLASASLNQRKNAVFTACFSQHRSNSGVYLNSFTAVSFGLFAVPVLYNVESNSSRGLKAAALAHTAADSPSVAAAPADGRCACYLSGQTAGGHRSAADLLSVATGVARPHFPQRRTTLKTVSLPLYSNRSSDAAFWSGAKHS